MPRKNARPAAKKAAARRKALIAGGKKPERSKPTVGHFGPYQPGLAGLMLGLAAFAKGSRRD